MGHPTHSRSHLDPFPRSLARSPLASDLSLALVRSNVDRHLRACAHFTRPHDLALTPPNRTTHTAAEEIELFFSSRYQVIRDRALSGEKDEYTDGKRVPITISSATGLPVRCS